MTGFGDKSNSTHPNLNRYSPPRFLFLFSALIWTLAIVGMAFWHYHSTRTAITENARTAARYSIHKDITYRQWATRHGGVYVPMTEQTPASPYLAHLPERDLVTPSGRQLTLLNPAYMTRQVHEIADLTFGSKGKLTSLDPLRPDNSPDPWERETLEAFAQGTAERSSFSQAGNDRYLRLMQPFITEEGCLKCHAHQGYKVGDVRGGISVSIPWAPYQQALVSAFSKFALGYSGIWLAGLMFIGLHRRKFNDFLLLRLQLEEQQKESLRHFQEIFDGVNDAILLHDLDSGAILDANAGAEREYGYSKEEMKQLSVTDISADEEPFTARAAAEWRAKACRGESPTFEWRARHQDGHLFWVEVNMRKADLPEHQVLLTTVRNIDERKVAEQQAHNYMQRLSKLAAQIPGMIYQYRLNPDGSSCLPYSSNGIRSLFHIEPEIVTADTSAIFARIHPEDLDTFASSIRQSAQELAVWHHQFRIQRPSAGYLWAEAIATPERLVDGSTLWHGYAQDISARKAAEELLENQQQELQKRNTELERFNYTVSHDLKTPLVTIETFLGFLKEDLDKRDQPAIDNDVHHIRTATKQMGQLLDSLLRLSHISHHAPVVKPCSFTKLIKKALILTAPAIDQRAISIKVAPGDTVVYVDPPRAIELWQNLIDNAVKYMGEQDQPSIELGFTATDPETIFYVRDNGIGIPPEYADTIFGLFNQLNKNAPGNGLGLTLVKHIVEQHRGRIWLESAGAGTGCCFYFTLPTAAPVGGNKP
ncbi:PAS domain S-box protein [Pelovirga terrestris]|uniref:histidine kinase n=1 Tax=Pelovirga terrestris TaxID=2771352 RepID=A0A8J6QXX5_9BACT|nr:PAS domain S-box protein [Pelovirga terrestris]MBD1401211.1 DUF3365 domain-containing protein [Pelovirga terrestris]